MISGETWKVVWNFRKNAERNGALSAFEERKGSDVFHADFTKAGFCVKMNFTDTLRIGFALLPYGTENCFPC